MIQYKDVFKIGRFYKPHGISGEITFAFTDDVFDRTDAPYWLIEIDGILVPFFLESYRFRSETTALVKMQDVDDEKEAALLSDRDVYYPKSYADESAPEEDTSWHFYTGFSLVDQQTGQVVGTIDEVDESTINALFLVKSGDQSFIIPATAALIVDKNLKDRVLYMNIPEGLLHLDKACEDK